MTENAAVAVHSARPPENTSGGRPGNQPTLAGSGSATRSTSGEGARPRGGRAVRRPVARSTSAPQRPRNAGNPRPGCRCSAPRDSRRGKHPRADLGDGLAAASIVAAEALWRAVDEDLAPNTRRASHQRFPGSELTISRSPSRARRQGRLRELSSPAISRRATTAARPRIACVSRSPAVRSRPSDWAPDCSTPARPSAFAPRSIWSRSAARKRG